MKRLLAMLVVVAFGTAVAFAEEKAAAEPTDMTLKGKLEKKTEGAGEKAKTVYTLVTADYGKVKLAKTEVKLDELVGQEVEMVVKAVVTEKDGKKRIHKPAEVVTAKKVEEAAKAVEAPKAPEAPKAEAPKAEEKK